LSRFESVRKEIGEGFQQAALVNGHSIAVLLPCFNEGVTVGPVIEGFRKALPSAKIYVYDNNSTDDTYEQALQNGAIVRREEYQGKGNVVRRMFADIDADIYVLADGDATYDPSAASTLLETLVTRNLDMVVGARNGSQGAFPQGHRFGNQLFNFVVKHLFGRGFTDILSGYRVMSRRFAKSFPATSSGFEIEAELSVHALDLRIAATEVALPYGKRPEGSLSKLRTYRDGLRIFSTLISLYREMQPLRFFCAIGCLLMIASAGLGAPLLDTYFRTGLVPRFPTAILAAALAQLGFLSVAVGVILDAVSKSRREAKRMRYLELHSIATRR
jgi:glycosyltransferase involved in cell wall biosynthesis